MSVYQTKYSDLFYLNKKDRKIKESHFPFVSPNSNSVNLESCGQKVSKNDKGSNIKFCPICDYPMIVRMMTIPCDHVMCYSCSQPQKDYCYICEGKIDELVRIRDTDKLYECDYPDCFKFFISLDKLNIHKFIAHNYTEEGFNPAIININNMNNIGMNMVNMGLLNNVNRNMIPGGNNLFPMMPNVPLAMNSNINSNVEL